MALKAIDLMKTMKGRHNNGSSDRREGQNTHEDIGKCFRDNQYVTFVHKVEINLKCLSVR